MKKQQEAVRAFLKERDWEQFHTPKELLLGMVEEIGELRNIIKWEKDETKIRAKMREHFDEVEDFFGDMFYELCSLANACGVDIETAFEKVMANHSHRFPIKTHKGKHTNE